MRHYTANYVANIKEPEIMKKSFFAVLFVLFGVAAFGQQLPTVAVATFDARSGITPDEVDGITELFITELVASKLVNVVDRNNFDKIIAEMKFQVSDWSNSRKTAALGNALNAQYIIRGQVGKLGGAIYWTATMVDVNTAQVLYSGRDQVNSLDQIFNRMGGFCAQMLAQMPPQNYFVGRWEGVTSSGQRCIVVFNHDGSIIVERWEIQRVKNNYILKGTGNYAFSDDEVVITLLLDDDSVDKRRGYATYSFNDYKNELYLKWKFEEVADVLMAAYSTPDLVAFYGFFKRLP
jgi:TolB-like protein